MYYFLVNPASKSNHGMEVWNEIEEYLCSQNVPFEVFFSKRAGHIHELMYDICTSYADKEEIPNVVVLGGDGSFNEALQGVINFNRVNIGYIPTGSSNDFARACMYSKDPIENVKHVLACSEPLKYDIGRLRYEHVASERSVIAKGSVAATRYFNVSCGIGFDAAVCEEALDSKLKSFLNKIHLGKLAYGMIAVKQIFSAKLCDAELTLDNDETVFIKDCRFVVGMNTCFEGGGYKFAPAAVPDDGYLDICTVGNISPIGVILTLPSAVKGEHIKKKQIHTYRVKQFEVKTKEPLWVHTDGEVYTKADHIKVSLIPGGLNFLWK